MRFKRALSALSALVLLLSVVPPSSFAQDDDASTEIQPTQELPALTEPVENIPSSGGEVIDEQPEAVAAPAPVPDPKPAETGPVQDPVLEQEVPQPEPEIITGKKGEVLPIPENTEPVAMAAQEQMETQSAIMQGQEVGTDKYQWTQTAGGSGNDMASSVATDPSGNVYVVGAFKGTVDFDPGTDVESHGNSDIFLTKYDAAGAYQWTQAVGGSGNDMASSVATDRAGNVYLEGRFQGTVDFDPGTDVDNHTGGGNDIFLTKYDAAGIYQWTQTVGDRFSTSVATDPAGNVYLAGYFGGTVDFDPGTAVDSHTSNSGFDYFLSKYAASDGTPEPPVFECGTSTVQDTDGNSYGTTNVNGQCWMKENMRVGTMVPGTTEQTNNGTIEKYCYDNDAANCTTDGGLYQWDEAMQYSTTKGAQGICPAGWHIPTDAEQYALENYLKDPGQSCDAIRGGSTSQGGVQLFYCWSKTNAWYCRDNCSTCRQSEFG